MRVHAVDARAGKRGSSLLRRALYERFRIGSSGSLSSASRTGPSIGSPHSCRTTVATSTVEPWRERPAAQHAAYRVGQPGVSSLPPGPPLTVADPDAPSSPRCRNSRLRAHRDRRDRSTRQVIHATLHRELRPRSNRGGLGRAGHGGYSMEPRELELRHPTVPFHSVRDAERLTQSTPPPTLGSGSDHCQPCTGHVLEQPRKGPQPVLHAFPKRNRPTNRNLMPRSSGADCGEAPALDTPISITCLTL